MLIEESNDDGQKRKQYPAEFKAKVTLTVLLEDEQRSNYSSILEPIVISYHVLLDEKYGSR